MKRTFRVYYFIKDGNSYIDFKCKKCERVDDVSNFLIAAMEDENILFDSIEVFNDLNNEVTEHFIIRKETKKV